MTELEMALKTVSRLQTECQALTKDLREARARLDQLIADAYESGYLKRG